MNIRLLIVLIACAVYLLFVGRQPVESMLFQGVEGNFAYENPNDDVGGIQASIPNVDVPPGVVVIWCLHTDVKGRVWTTY